MPVGCLYLCEGARGVGKTTLSMQFLMKRGEQCLYVADREEPMRAGFDAHLLKPIDPGSLEVLLAGPGG